MALNQHPIAQDVYDKAVELYNVRYTNDAAKRQWIGSRNTLADVEAAVVAAKDRYEAKSQSRARKALGRFSSGIMYYGNIMDVLAQHHPEYVSLAWGTMKMLFVVSYFPFTTRHVRWARKLIYGIAGDEQRGDDHRTC